MPRAKITSPEGILKMVEKKRERDKKAQAVWVEKNKELHLERMKQQYKKKKDEETRRKKENTAMGNEDRDAVVLTLSQRVKLYKARHPEKTQRQIAEDLGTSQSSVQRILKG